MCLEKGKELGEGNVGTCLAIRRVGRLAGVLCCRMMVSTFYGSGILLVSLNLGYLSFYSVAGLGLLVCGNFDHRKKGHHKHRARILRLSCLD